MEASRGNVVWSRDGRPIAYRSRRKAGVRLSRGAVLDIYDALHTVGGIDHVLVRHEQAAVHMADGPREPLATLAWCW